jgi:hypothetical protein
MKFREHLDKVVEGNTVDLLWNPVKTLERRELKFRDRPGAPETILELVKGRLNDDRLRRSISLQPVRGREKADNDN